MIASATCRGYGIWAAALFAFLLSTAPALAFPFHPATIPVEWVAVADPTTSERSAPPSNPRSLIRIRAAAAERIGDWENAFSAYCELYAADRSAPHAREKLNAALRRVQQFRRHRDPAFRDFVAGLSLVDAVSLFAEATAKIPPTFADPAMSTPQHLWASGIEELDRALGSSSFQLAFLEGSATAKVEAFRIELRRSWARRSVADPLEARAALKQLIAATQDAFHVRVPAALPVEMIFGACAGLDEYSVFLLPGQITFQGSATDLSTYGLYLSFREGIVTIDRVAPGSWAAFHTTLRKGDRLARLNGLSTVAVGPDAISDALKAASNGFHEIVVVPSSQDSMPPAFHLPINLPTVFGERIINAKDGVGYVRIGEFNAHTSREFSEAIAHLKLEGLRVMLLDLRGNRGGSFASAVEVVRQLLPGGPIVTTQGQLGEVAGRSYSTDGMGALDLPLVVLIDAETASAAEMVAAALRDGGRAALVGMPTFGKGTIQYHLKLTAADEVDGTMSTQPRSGSVRVTIARMLSPRGTPIDGVGVAPHIVEFDPTRQLNLAIERALDLIQTGMRPGLPPPNR